MIESVAKQFEEHKTLRVIQFAERMILDGDHAGVSETSFMLYLDKTKVNMTAIGEANYQDHGWNETKAPENRVNRTAAERPNSRLPHFSSTGSKSTQ